MNPIARFCRGNVLLLLVALTVPLTTACKPKRYEVVTRITPDGHFHREIYQPIDESLLPEALAQGKVDPAASQPAEYKVAARWQEAWQSCKITGPPENAWEGKYLKCRGEFADADAIPRSYHLPVQAIKDRASTNQIRHEYQDYVLFGIDSWVETITETIRLDEYVEALDELIAAALPAIEAALDELLGEEYELSELHKFLRTEAATVYRRYCLAVYQYAADGRHSPGHLDWKHLKDILAGVGFDLPLNEDGDAVVEEGLEQRVKQYCADLFRRTVVSKTSGERLTAEQARQMVDRVEVLLGKDESEKKQQEGDNKQQGGGQEQQDKKPAFTEAFTRQLVRLYGEHYEGRFKTLAARMCGAHGHGPVLMAAIEVFGGRGFEYTIETAGPILETDGARTGARTVRWAFTSTDLFPNGYTMRARSIRRRVEVEKRLFGRVVLDDLDRVFLLMGQIPAEGPVREALQAAVKRESLEPVETLLESSDEAQRKAARMILDLSKRRPESRPE